MSGTRAAWTPERRAAQSERMRARYADPECRRTRSENQRTIMADAGRRAACSERMTALNERMKSDMDLKIANHTGRIRALARPGYIEKLSARMKRTYAEHPDMRRKAREHAALLDHSANAKKRWARARGGEIPVGFEQQYRKLQRKVGTKDALLIVRQEAARAEFRVEEPE